MFHSSSIFDKSRSKINNAYEKIFSITTRKNFHSTVGSQNISQNNFDNEENYRLDNFEETQPTVNTKQSYISPSKSTQEARRTDDDKKSRFFVKLIP